MEPLSHPFIWLDVALVHVLCAMPLAWLLAAIISHRAPLAASLVLAACLLSIVAMLVSYPLVGVVFRTAAALGLALAAALLWSALRRGGSTLHASAVSTTLAAIVALLLPWTYVDARIRHDLATLGDMIELSRIGDARALVHRLLALDPERSFRGVSLASVAADVDRVAQGLEIQVGVPLAANATAEARLERARQLAMLGRESEASNVLSFVNGPEAVSLQATILENQGDWEAALLAYSKAQRAWRSQPPSDARAIGLQQATRGIAYAQRKSGRYAEAEATYQELLAMAPTAESHFLLAQFYEDTQQSEQARGHARRAMALAPDAYRQSGEKLIRKLLVHHFGCLGVHRAASAEHP